jgi:rhomboid protease GluP
VNEPNRRLPPPQSSPPIDAWKPWATYALIAANVGAFLLELSKGGGLSGSGLEDMVSLGANFGPLTQGGQPWRLLTSMFLHFGVVHLGMNMVCLYQVRFVERMLGRAEFLALYFVSGLLGGLASVATHPLVVSAGASGAVFGMFGAFTAVMVVRRKRIEPGAWSRTMRSLGGFFALNLVIGLSARSVDLAAHLGGLVAGFVGAFVLTRTASPTARPLLRALVLATVGAGIAFGGVFALPR